MQEQDKTKFAEAMAGLCATFGREAERPLLQAYWFALRDMSLGEFHRACERALRECVHFPKPVELRKMGGELTVSDRCVLAFDAVRKAINSRGGYSSVEFDDPLINATIRNIGGWPRLCALPSEDFEVWARKEFERIYASLCQSGVTEEAAAYLPGVHEQDPFPGHEVCVAQVSTGLPPHRENPVKQIGDGGPGDMLHAARMLAEAKAL